MAPALSKARERSACRPRRYAAAGRRGGLTLPSGAGGDAVHDLVLVGDGVHELRVDGLLSDVRRGIDERYGLLPGHPPALRDGVDHLVVDRPEHGLDLLALGLAHRAAL